MKLNKNLLLAGAIATFATSSIAWADQEPAVKPSPAVEEPAIDETILDEPDVEEADTDDSSVDITLYTGEEDGDGEEPEIVICDMEEEDTPIDEWEPGGPEVQRNEDGEVDPVIFQTTALGGGGGLEATADKTAAGSGSDERAANIQDKESGVTSVQPQKKGPVALVQKGRVFLR